MAIKPSSIRTFYFYIISLIGLLMIAFPTADLVNLALKTWIFPNAETAAYTCPTYFPAPTDSSVPNVEVQKQQCETDRARFVEERINTRQADAIRDFSFLVVGIPLFIFHFRIAQKERREEKDENKS